MKVHITSLQRTGSKSLQQAIHNALDNPLTIVHAGGSSNLGELFHGWEFSGYKFGHNARYPFDPAADIVFRTAANFDEYQGKSFIPVGNNDWLSYMEYQYAEELTENHVAYIRVLLDAYSNRSYVVKTQLSSLYEDVCFDGAAESWLSNVNRGFDVLIDLTPSNLVNWICSNFVCDTTGIFAPCPAQQEAGTQFKSAIPVNYVRRMMSRLMQHHRLLNRFAPNKGTKVIRLTTDQLSDPHVVAHLARQLDIDFQKLVIKHTKEFSAEGYEKLIENYKDIQSMIDNYQHDTSMIPHIMVWPLSYPIA